MMKKQSKLLTASVMAVALTLAGCWDDDNNNNTETITLPVVIAEVPDSAGLSTAAFFSYLLSLAVSDESSEPLTLKDTFAVPADESAEPTPLT